MAKFCRIHCSIALFLGLSFVFLTSCSSDPNLQGRNNSIFKSMISRGVNTNPVRDFTSNRLGSRSDRPIREVFEPGTDSDFRSSAENDAPKGIFSNGQKVSVNFVNTELQEFARAVFEDVLKKNYTIDPRLKGAITIRTTLPIHKQHLLELMRQALAANNAKLFFKNDTYQIVAGSNGQTDQPIRMVHLRFISADKLTEELKPLVPAGVQVIPSKSISALFLKGPLQKIDALHSIIRSFDIDRMKGMSFAVLPVRNAPASIIAEELSQVLGADDQPSTSILAISRMNSLLVISKRSSVLYAAKDWLRKLDQKNLKEAQSYVYSVQNRRAEELATVLRQAFISNNQTGTSPRNSKYKATAIIPALNAPPDRRSREHSIKQKPQIKITADPTTNSLIIFCTPEQYKLIRSALYRLDIVPLQVLIEATIAEVRLNHDLRHGVSWFLKTKHIGANFSTAEDGSVSEKSPGFNFVIDIPRGKFILNALEGVTDVEIVSTPSMTVLDNQTARLQVGDQVPIATRSAKSTTDATAPIVNTIELKDTGIILSVTPRVNASGLVILDIVQEASDVIVTSTSGIDSPTIRQRKFESSIAVKNGMAIVLGGLISRRKDTGESGVPIVKDIPLLGNLFKTKTKKHEKIELIAIIRPTVIRNQQDIRAIAGEFRRKMRGINGIKP